MSDDLINNPFLWYSLVAVFLLVIGWRIFERRWDSRIFDKDRKGVFKNLHAKAALFAYDHVKGLVPVDVRSHKEFEQGHIPGAINATVKDSRVESGPLEGLDREVPVLVYCEGGYASRKTVELLKEMGFHTIYHIHRGFKSWQFYGGAVESGAAEGA